jgi:hypothetical protein
MTDAFKEAGIWCTRIESPETAPGFADLVVIGHPVIRFVELKAEDRMMPTIKEAPKWRPAQRSFINNVFMFSLGTERAATLIRYTDVVCLLWADTVIDRDPPEDALWAVCYQTEKQMAEAWRTISVPMKKAQLELLDRWRQNVYTY